MAMRELIIRVLCDVRSETIVDGAVLFSQTTDNQPSVFAAAKKIFFDRLADKILCVKTGPQSGYPGFSVWRDNLGELGIPNHAIVGVELMKSCALNTLTEAEAIIDCARQKGYRSLYVVSSPFHQLRAYMTLVTVALRVYPDILIYSYTGTALPWLEKTVHSQGTLSGARNEFIKTEFERIEIYQHKGDLAFEADIIEYLNKRDRIISGA